MRRNDWWLKLLVLLPVFALAGLLVWVSLGQMKNGRGAKVILAEEEPGGRPSENSGLGEAGRQPENLEPGEAGRQPAVSGSGETGRQPENSGPGETGRQLEISGSGENPAGEPSEGAVSGMSKDQTNMSGSETKAPSDQLEETQNQTVRLVFAGDILLSDHVLRAYEQSGGIGGVLDEGYRAELAQADIFMANEEFPFSSRGSAAKDKQYTFRLPPERATIFQELGLDIVALANNHALDFGRDALLDTCRTLDAAGIRYVGAGENLDRAKRSEIIEVKGKKIGFIAASRVLPEASWAAGAQTPGMLSAYEPAVSVLLSEIESVRMLCDYLVVYIHWGIERSEMPEDYERVLGKKMIDAGADLVIGSHPHVLQGVEFYEGRPIFYSLGNFIFGSSIPKTALLSVDIPEDGSSPVFRLAPGTSGAGYTYMLDQQEKKEDFYSYIESISPGLDIDENGCLTGRPWP